MKSFFVFTVSCGLAQAKTLIFQSSEAPTSTPQSSPSQSSAASTAFSTPPASNVNSEIFFMVEQLKQEVMMLRGLIEEQDFQLRQIQERSKDRYRDLDDRLQTLAKSIADLDRKKGSSATTANPAVSSNSVDIQPAAAISAAVVPVGGSVQQTEETEEQKVAYQKAYSLVKDKNFPEAIDALHAYVEKYPEGDLTGNAFYWLGEVYLVLPKLEQAKQAFSIVVKTFPGHRKLPDAMYKLAVAHDRLQEPVEAERYLKQVQEQFPNTTAAKLASSYAVSR